MRSLARPSLFVERPCWRAGERPVALETPTSRFPPSFISKPASLFTDDLVTEGLATLEPRYL
ncbi:hypothetical protein BCO9919_06175 [Burkholderia cenocepacia]|uniref:Uncharacterized protein n=1 Tax=Burkholderia cenocepacia TaxID=95486 RepID=A0A6J5JQT6_9BURK|nr:hypothetical protein BCO9919_06175 [Burkholderia cenocepacia]